MEWNHRSATSLTSFCGSPPANSASLAAVIDSRKPAAGGDPQKLVNEVADLWFHSMIALAHFNLSPLDVVAELARREGLSGLEEKALRKVREREAQGD